MKKHFNQKLYSFLLATILCLSSSQAQTLPNPALVGYWENWGNLQLSQVHTNYNIIDLAFAVTTGSSLYSMEFTLPSGYPKATFLADIDVLHAAGKKVILSVGGANDPVFLSNASEVSTFVSTMNKIYTDYNDKFDGIDLDLESTSFSFGNNWTMTAPAAGQINIINAVKQIMADYQARTGKKLLLTMAPETYYVVGALSNYQINNNGGSMLPIIEALRNDLDMLHCQLYNAGGSTGGNYAIDGNVYYDTGNGDYITAMTESVIKGFTCLNGKGVFSGLPANKVGFGLPACSVAAGTGYVQPAVVCQAAKYLRGIITKPNGWNYTVTTQYPILRGMMTWDINIDKASCGNSFATNFSCAFNTSTNMDELSGTTNFSLYPNPATNEITIEIDNAFEGSIKMFDLLGQLVFEKQTNQQKIIINVSNLPVGFYTMTDGRTVKKLIKQ